MTPKKTVMVAFLGCAILIFGGHVMRGKLPTYRQLGGLFLAFAALGIGVELMPEPAAALSMVILVTVALETSGDIGPQVSKFLSGKGSTKQTTKQTTSGEYENNQQTPTDRVIVRKKGTQ